LERRGDVRPGPRWFARRRTAERSANRPTTLGVRRLTRPIARPGAESAERPLVAPTAPRIVAPTSGRTDTRDAPRLACMPGDGARPATARLCFQPRGSRMP